MQPATVLIVLFGVLAPFSYQMVQPAYVSNNMFTIEHPVKELAWNDEEIRGYHFHTYFFQNNAISTNEALSFRIALQDRIDSGMLGNCRLNNVNVVPRGPHPIGSYETCCNKTSISPAISFFMQNRGNLSILLHALTRWEVEDHTTRSMFLGPRLPLDTSALREDLEDNLDLCLPL